jgi:hypothetical protein
MELNYSDFVHAIDEHKHSRPGRHTAPHLPVQRHRTRRALAEGLHRLADKLDG